MVRGDGTSKLIPFPDLLTMNRDTAQSQMDVFAPESWGLVQFLLNAPDRAYSQGALGFASRALSPKATLDDNSQKHASAAFSWVPTTRRCQLTSRHTSCQ